MIFLINLIQYSVFELIERTTLVPVFRVILNLKSFIKIFTYYSYQYSYFTFMNIRRNGQSKYLLFRQNQLT